MWKPPGIRTDRDSGSLGIFLCTQAPGQNRSLALRINNMADAKVMGPCFDALT